MPTHIQKGPTVAELHEAERDSTPRQGRDMNCVFLENSEWGGEDKYS